MSVEITKQRSDVTDDSDEEMFYTPPTSPIAQPLDEDDTIDMASWKLDILHNYVKEQERIKAKLDLDYKRTMALFSTVSKRLAKTKERKTPRAIPKTQQSPTARGKVDSTRLRRLLRTETFPVAPPTSPDTRHSIPIRTRSQIAKQNYQPHQSYSLRNKQPMRTQQWGAQLLPAYTPPQPVPFVLPMMPASNIARQLPHLTNKGQQNRRMNDYNDIAQLYDDLENQDKKHTSAVKPHDNIGPSVTPFQGQLPIVYTQMRAPRISHNTDKKPSTLSAPSQRPQPIAVSTSPSKTPPSASTTASQKLPSATLSITGSTTQVAPSVIPTKRAPANVTAASARVAPAPPSTNPSVSSPANSSRNVRQYRSPLEVFGIHMESVDADESLPMVPSSSDSVKKQLCIFEAEGGTCNDDTCRSSHFRDFE